MDADLVARWHPLAEWARRSAGGDVSRAARELLGGVEPEDPANRKELLVLALLAVSVNRVRLCEEFAARSFLGPGASLDALVSRQEYLTEETIGTASPLKTLGVLVSESLPDSAWFRIHRSVEPGWAQAAGWRGEAAVIWLAAVRFGHLAQTIAQALALDDTVRFYRYLPAKRWDDPNALVPNDIACVNEPWAAGTRRMLSYVEDGSHIFELVVPLAGIVAVAHIDPSHAHEKHPARFGAESGHPVVTVYPPLAQFAPDHYTGPRQLVQWRRVTPAEVCNHRAIGPSGDDG
ncbi:hypothetical protein BH09ACT7_BH09ACT7_54450 [soil metagenome]